MTVLLTVLAAIPAVLLTILKIIGWILLAVLILILIVLILPVRAEVSFIDKSFTYRVRLWFVTVISSGGGGIVGWLKKHKARKSGADEEDSLTHSGIDGFMADTEPASEEDPEPAAETVPETAAPAPVVTEEAAADSEKVPEPPEYWTDEEPPKKKRRKRKKDSPEAKKEPDDEPEGKTLGEKVEFILDIWRAADRPLLRIFKGFRLYDLYMDFIIANEDAYKCAVTYGRICGIVYPLLGWLSTLFSVRLKTVDINPGFGLEESRWDAAVKVSFRAGTLVIAGLWFLVTYIFRYFIPGKLRDRKIKKAARQK